MDTDRIEQHRGEEAIALWVASSFWSVICRVIDKNYRDGME